MTKKHYLSCKAYNPRRFSDMSAAEVLDFAQHFTVDCFPLTREERTQMTAAIVSAVRWGLARDAEYRARLRWEARLREERERSRQQQLTEARERRTPDIVVHI